jgi:hypothetical protein
MSEWISVKDRLPDDRLEVDVWILITPSPSSFGMGDSWRIPNAYRLKGKWVHLHKCEEAELRGEYITHWIPVPEPPIDPDRCDCAKCELKRKGLWK